MSVSTTTSKSHWFSTKSDLVETAAVVALVGAIAGVVWQAWRRMLAAGVVDNFSVLLQPTNWDLSSSIFGHSPSDAYWLTLTIGVANTLCIGIPAIVLATAAGLAIGVARTGNNRALAGLAKIFVEVFRNVPVLVQIVFWYTLLLHAPLASNAFSLDGYLVVTNRGIYFAYPEVGALFCALTALGALMAFIAFRWKADVSVSRSTLARLHIPASLAIFALVCGALMLATSPYSVPKRRGFGFQGGASVGIEYAALLVGLVVYGAAYIAEIVRGGLNSVPRGQVEAGRSLGLSNWQILAKIKAPLALRLIILPLSNQYLFLIKGTGLGLAVGFAELFQVTVTSINQTGKSIDFLVIMMLAYICINFSIAKFMSLANSRAALKGHARV